MQYSTIQRGVVMVDVGGKKVIVVHPIARGDIAFEYVGLEEEVR
jgi:hypothetical protein